MTKKLFETHRSFVNTWECDENDHMNVQFYFKRFEEAADFLAIQCELETYNPMLLCRHVRYHKELRSADSTIVNSGIVEVLSDRIKIAHQMVNTTTGTLSASALDTVSLGKQEAPPIRLPRAPVEFLEPVLPRGVADGPSEPFDSGILLGTGKATLSNHSIVRDFDLDEKRCLLTSRIISRFTDGAPHIWDHFGITTDWLAQTKNGRVAVELKLTPLATAKPGDALRLVSNIPESQGKTFLVRHQLENAATGEIIARGDVRALVMSLITRRAIELPDFIGGISV
jgi:acyl-CoA thioester hydrolase